jgi:hypothetical protein
MGPVPEYGSGGPAFSAMRRDRSMLDGSRPFNEHSVSGLENTEPAVTMEDAPWKMLA